MITIFKYLDFENFGPRPENFVEVKPAFYAFMQSQKQAPSKDSQGPYLYCLPQEIPMAFGLPEGHTMETLFPFLTIEEPKEDEKKEEVQEVQDKEVQEEPKEVDLDTMDVAQLKELAKKHGIKLGNTKNIEKIKDKIQDHFSSLEE